MVTKNRLKTSQQEAQKNVTTSKRAPNAVDDTVSLAHAFNTGARPAFALNDQKVTPLEISTWLSCFGLGLNYVLKNYGDTAGHLQLYDTITFSNAPQAVECCIFYDANDDLIAVTKGFIARDIINTRGNWPLFGNNNTAPRGDFTGHEMAFLLGVEEGYHAYQYKHKKHLYPQKDWETGADARNIGQTSHYRHNRVEREARQAVLMAARDLRLGSDPRYIRVSSNCSKQSLAPFLSFR